MESKYKIVYLMRAVTQGGTDTLLETYVKYFSEKKHEIFIISSSPINHEKSLYNSFKNNGAKIIEPSSSEKIIINILVEMLTFSLFFPRKILYRMDLRFNDVSFMEFKENVRKKLYLILLSIKLPIFHNKENPTIYHSIGTRMELKLFNIFFRFKDVKIIFSEVENPGLRPSYNHSFAKFLGKCKTIISPSRLIKNEISNIVPKLDKEIQIIPWTISIKGINSNEAKKSNLFIIGALGRFDYGKGFHILFNSLFEINKRFEDWELILAGDGEEKENLIRLAKELGLSNKIKFIGWVSDVSNFFEQIDIFVNPSFTEGMPMVIIEALYYSKPIIATNVGSVSEMFDLECGAIIEHNNIRDLQEKLFYFIEHQEELKSKSYACKKMFENKFSSKVILEKLEKVYDNVINNNI